MMSLKVLFLRFICITFYKTVNLGGGGMSVDSNTLKRMLKPMPSLESPVTSPEMTRRRYNYYNHHGNTHYNHQGNNTANNNARHVLSEPETMGRHKTNRFSGNQLHLWLCASNLNSNSIKF